MAALSLISFAYGALLTESIAAIQCLPVEIIAKGFAPNLCPTTLHLLGMTCKDLKMKCQVAFSVNFRNNKGTQSIIDVEALYDIYNGAGPVDPINKPNLKHLILKYLPAPRDIKHGRIYKIYKEALFIEGPQRLPIIASKRFPELCRMIFKHKSLSVKIIDEKMVSELLKPYVVDVGLSCLSRLNAKRKIMLGDLAFLDSETAIIFYKWLEEADRIHIRGRNHEKTKRTAEFFTFSFKARAHEMDQVAKLMPNDMDGFLEGYIHQLLKFADPQIVSMIMKRINPEYYTIENILIGHAFYKRPFCIYEAIRGQQDLEEIKKIFIRMSNGSKFESPDAIPLHIFVEAGIMMGASDDSILEILDNAHSVPPYVSILAMIKNVRNTLFYAILEKTEISGKFWPPFWNRKSWGVDLNPFLFAHMLSHDNTLCAWFIFLWKLASKGTRSVKLLEILPDNIQKRIACDFYWHGDFTMGLARTLDPLENISKGLIWASSLGGRIDLNEAGYNIEDLFDYMSRAGNVLENLLFKLPQKLGKSLSSLCRSNSFEKMVLYAMTQENNGLALLENHYRNSKQSFYMVLFAFKLPQLSISEMVDDMPDFQHVDRFFKKITTFYKDKLAHYHDQINELYVEIGKRIDDERYLKVFASVFFWHMFYDCFPCPYPNPLFTMVGADHLRKIIKSDPKICLLINKTKKRAEHFHSLGLSKYILEAAISNGLCRNADWTMRSMRLTLMFLGMNRKDVEALHKRIHHPHSTIHMPSSSDSSGSDSTNSTDASSVSGSADCLSSTDPNSSSDTWADSHSSSNSHSGSSGNEFCTSSDTSEDLF